VKSSVHLTRSNGYRELGMFDESILELEAIEGEDRWHSSVVEARYNTYKDAEAWELAMPMAELMHERKPTSFVWFMNLVDAKSENGDPTGALQLLKDAVIKFSERTEFVYALARQHALLGEIEDAKLFVKRAIKRDASVKEQFLDDPAFDSVWDSC